MPMGRPSTRERTAFGQRLFERREAAGLTQAEVAEQLGLSQRAYAAWERDAVAILPERLAAVAGILGTSVADLLGEAAPARPQAPRGRLGRVFDEVSELPRRQQQRIVDVVEDMLAARQAKA